MAEIETQQPPLSPSQWCDIPADILALISDRLDHIGNLRLRSVCSDWRSAVPLLNHASEVPFESPAFYRHFSISRNTSYFLRSPAAPWWLLRLESKGIFGKFRPLNPFFKSQIPLEGFPSEINLLDLRICEIRTSYRLNWRRSSRNRLRSKVVVSSDKWIRNPGDEQGDFAVLVLFDRKLGFIKSGGENWIRIDGPNRPIYDDDEDIYYDSKLRFDDILYRKEKNAFYAVNIMGRLIMIGRDFEPKVLISGREYSSFGSGCYLVEFNGELFFVVKLLSNDMDDDIPFQFTVYKLNEENKTWDCVTPLDDMVIFIGTDVSYAVSAKQFGLEVNCIYFAHDYRLVRNASESVQHVGIFCMKRGSCKIFSSRAWIQPLKMKAASQNQKQYF